MRIRTNARRKSKSANAWYLLYLLGRTLQVTGLVTTLVAATAYFGTRDTVVMLRTMLAGVLVFLPGWWLVKRAGDSQKDRG
ncbi:MAG TPA: hypothetical protein VFQ51_09740 [Vicinamibacteria bacterium]|nr:hypothetical protein [Vicinamibacteria bacterium]